MDPQLTSIQPGGGVVVRLELAWGYVRRALLKTFCRQYVEEMARKRKGDANPCPHEVLDPRDLKFYRNQPGFYWEVKDDPFAYRDRLPFVREGLAELLVFSLLTFVPAFYLARLHAAGSGEGWKSWAQFLGALALAVAGCLTIWFFRNPQRNIPTEDHAVVSPADGEIVTIDYLEHDPFLGGPAILIGIFLSIFNVHANRAPRAARVIGLQYTRGKYLNALRPESVRENERLAIRLQETTAPYRPMIVRQIAGAIARRIVCRVRPGDQLGTGEPFGMIKLGSRTELVIPQDEGLRVMVQIGDLVSAGDTIVATYVPPLSPPRSA